MIARQRTYDSCCTLFKTAFKHEIEMELDAQNELRIRADEVLHYLWDPIGVAGEPMARDEYSSYVLDAVEMLLAGAPANAIADRLSTIRTEHMGLQPNRSKDEEAVEVLFAWKSKLDEMRPRILGS